LHYYCAVSRPYGYANRDEDINRFVGGLRVNSTIYKYPSPWHPLATFLRAHDINVHEKPMVGSSIGHFAVAIHMEEASQAVVAALAELRRQLEDDHNIWWNGMPSLMYDHERLIHIALLRGAHW
jgi:hypothetical protein